MDLILLDVDGTLVDSTEIDARCFLQAISDEFGINEIDTDWSAYPDTTDAAILSSILHQARQEHLTPERIVRLKNRFYTLLRNEIAYDPSLCRPIGGGPEFVRLLRESPRFTPAIATGGWRQTAALKLASAGYEIEKIPFASCDDSDRRTGILATAVDRARRTHHDARFRTITSIGDGVWDAQAARAMGYRFIRRGDPSQEDAATRAARATIQDFSSPETLLRILDE